MSYILEALKKSDQKHQLGTVPGLHTVHTPMPARGGGRKVWLALALVALTINAGVVGWWLWSSRGNAPGAAPPPAAAEVSPAPSPVPIAPEPLPVATRMEVGQPEMVSESAELLTARQEVMLARQEAMLARQEAVQVRQTVSGALPAVVAGAPSRGVAGPEQGQPVSEPLATVAKGERPAVGVSQKVEELAAPQEVAAEPPAEELPEPPLPAPAPKAKARVVNASATEDPLTMGMGLVAIEEPKAGAHQPEARAKKTAKEPAERLPGLNTLPDSVRATIPPLAISFHSYSTVANSSLVRINGKILREGDLLEPGLKVEKITPTGVVFSCKGEQFHVPMS